MKTKHTPGKWKALNNTTIVTDEEDPQIIAYLSCHRNKKRRTKVETSVNARLIENAPELLNVLVALLEKINNSSVDDWKEIENANQLIKKITNGKA